MARNKADPIAVRFAELGRIAGNGDVARIDACEAYAQYLADGKLGLPARDHADFAAANKTESEKRAFEFLDARSQVSNAGKVNPKTVETYATHYRTFANAGVAKIADIKAAVTAFTVGKTKKQMENKGAFDIMYNLASKASKATTEKPFPAKITPSYIKDSIKPGTSRGTDGGTAKTPAEIASAAFVDGLKAMLKDGECSKANAKRIRELAAAMKIDLA